MLPKRISVNKNITIFIDHDSGSNCRDLLSRRIDMFECPRCHTGVPKWKSAIMSNYTKITCEGCGVVLKPDRSSMEKIGGIGAAIGIGLAMIAIRTVGIMGVIPVFVILYAIACVVTINITEFEIVDE